MFAKLLTGLTREQKSALREASITDQQRSDWLHDRRTPTEAELLILADVAEADVRELLREIAELKAKPAQRPFLARVLGKALVGAAVMLVGFGASDRAPGAGARAHASEIDNVCYVNNLMEVSRSSSAVVGKAPNRVWCHSRGDHRAI